MKIALAQMNVTPQQVNENLSTMIKMMDHAKNQGADFVVFPEWCLSGKILNGKTEDSVVTETLLEAEAKLLEKSKELPIVAGLFEICEDVYRSKPYFLIQGEKKEYSSEIHGKKIVISSLEKANEVSDADFIVSLMAKDWGFDHDSAKEAAMKLKLKTPLVLVNACGMQSDGKMIRVFDGGSSLFDCEGQFVAGCNDLFQEECRVVELNTKEEVETSGCKLLDALLCAVKEVDRQWFGSRIKWIIGLSGGLDSTVNAALLAMALDPKRIVGYNMATRYNSLSTKDNARDLANNLKIEIREGSIEKMVESTISTIQEYKYTDEYGSLVYENIQARLRGHLLSTFASIEGGVIVNNGNKVEVALGYCTLYGDAIGAFSPIGDCTKVQLFELAEEINRRFGFEVIMSNLLPKVEGETIDWKTPPSAELKDAQKDPMKWFYHDWLTNVLCAGKLESINDLLKSWLDGSLFDTEGGKWLRYYGLDHGKAFIEDLEWFTKTMQRNSFKHHVLPPIVKISHHDFNENLLKTSGSEYERLKEEIMLKG